MRVCFSYPNCSYYNKSGKTKDFISKKYLLYSHIQVRRNNRDKSKVKIQL